MREEIISLLDSVKRQGIEGIKQFMCDTDFFTAPCSTQYHLARPGGLAEHSLHVYELLKEKIERYGFGLQIPLDSLIICGLCHDLCKANFYVQESRNVKENGIWKEKLIYVVKDKFPMGHGEKSVSILQDYIKLTPQEKLAIRWHMLAFDAGIHFNYPSGFAFREASKDSLVVLLFTADYEASQILEMEGGVGK